MPADRQRSIATLRAAGPSHSTPAVFVQVWFLLGTATRFNPRLLDWPGLGRRADCHQTI